MPLATETVNIDITLPDGNEFAAATFVARINAPSWDTTDNQAVPQVDVVASLDSSGTGSIELWPNDRGENGTYYTAVVRAVLTGEHVEREYRIGPFQPADGGGPFDLNALLSLGFSNITSITPTFTQRAEAAATLAEAWAESPTAPDPDDATTKSAKTWAGEAQSTAETLASLATLEALVTDAQAAETGAETAQTGAETARDATVIAAAAEGVFHDTTIAAAITDGLAAVSDGGSFFAIGDDVDYIGLYEDDAGSEVEWARISKASALDAITAVYDPTSSDDAYHEIRAADGSVIMRFDETGASGPVVSGRKVSAIDDQGTAQAQFMPTGRAGRFVVEGADGREVMHADMFGLSARVMRPKYISSSRDMRTGLPMELAIPAIAAGAKGLRQINHVIGLGRSLMDGRGTNRYTVPRYLNVTGSGGSNTATGGAEGIKAFAPNVALSTDESTERPFFVMPDHALTLLNRHKGIDPMTLDCRFLVSGASIGGQTISGLISGTYPWVRNLIATAKATTEAMGMTYHFAGFLFLHADGVLGSGAPSAASPAAYRTSLEAYMAECRTIVAEETGQIGARVPWFFAAQNSGDPLAVDQNMVAVMQQQIALEDEYAFVPFSAHPTERMTSDPLADGADTVHISGYGTFELGMGYGRGLYRHYFTDDVPDTLLPVAAWAQGSDVFVRFNRGPLTTRTTSQPDGEPIHALISHFGLRVASNSPDVKFDSGTHTSRTITSSEIIGHDTVRLTLSAAPVDGDWLHIGGSNLAVLLDPDLYGDETTDGTVFTPYEIAAPAAMRITTNA